MSHPEHGSRPRVEEYGDTFVRIEEKTNTNWGKFESKEVTKIFVESPLADKEAEGAWYDEGGNLLERVVYTYNDKGVCTGEVWYNGNNEVFRKKNIIFDEEGRYNGVETVSGTAKRTWDE